MKIVIVGGGKLGYSLTENLLEEKHEVHLIEKDREKCIHLANELDAEVIYGDGTEIEPLERANTQEAGCLIAVTGSDQDNLVAAQLAKSNSRWKRSLRVRITRATPRRYACWVRISQSAVRKSSPI